MSVNDFVIKMFEARQQAHVLHLKTRSYAQHMALGSFYEDILDLIDEFVETYQGEYGILDLGKDLSVSYQGDALSYMTELAKYITDNRKGIGSPSDTHLQNIIDEMVATVQHTIYKLKFLA